MTADFTYLENGIRRDVDLDVCMDICNFVRNQDIYTEFVLSYSAWKTTTFTLSSIFAEHATIFH